MKKTQTLLPQHLYQKHLSTITNTHFTNREIDVIACLLSARRTSKIAQFLSIDPRTVETHIRNIMSKLQCNSRESIIDFIEASGKSSFLREYYALLRINAVFERHLKDISKLIREKDFHCFIEDGKDKIPLIDLLKSHLALAGIKASSKKTSDCVICLLPKTLSRDVVSNFLQKEMQSDNKTIFLLQERENNKELPEELKVHNVVDFSQQENYYFSFFIILEKLVPDLIFDKIVEEFSAKYKALYYDSKQLAITSNEKIPENKFRYKALSKLALASLTVFGLVCIGLLSFHWSQKNESLSFRSDLVMPTNSVRLDRPELIHQIDEQLKKQEFIQSVALVGPGGSGKTTLARQYATTQKKSPIWEIHAETRGTLSSSFEKLAQALVKTEIDEKILRTIQQINDPIEKEERIIQFVKNRLRNIPNWVLIFDNVEIFSDIQKYFPYDSETWGEGKVILTTRDSNISDNNYIKYVIHIGELSSYQKLEFFSKIMNNGHVHPSLSIKIEDTQKFLENIPSFPLDISIAAYYLKETNTPYEIYLRNLSQNNKIFEGTQEDILKEMGDYNKTRYNIIMLSLQDILKKHKEFKDLLVLISLIDSQNISKELLNNFKNEDVVTNFIFNLKKYSLFTNNSSNSSSNTSLSMHQSTQSISLSYLTEVLGLEGNKELIKDISEKFESATDEAIKERDLVKMKYLLSHIDLFLKHDNLLTPKITAALRGQLGIIHYFYGDNIKAKSLLEESVSKLSKFQEENPTRFAWFLGHLGNVHRDLGDYNKGKEFLRNSISIYDKYYPKDNFKHAYFLVYLGIIERYMGNYVVAKNLLERGMIICQNYFPENENFPPWVFGQLGVIEAELGNYQKAKTTLEQSILGLKKYRSTDHYDIAVALHYLGVAYMKLEKYEDSRVALEQSLRIFALYLPDQIGPSWILAHLAHFNGAGVHQNVKNLFAEVAKVYKDHFHEHYVYLSRILRQLGNLYIKLEKYEKAKLLLEESLFIYQKNYGDQHLETARTLRDLGQVYLLEGDLKTSEDLMKKSLIVFQQINHPEIYECLERLSELYLRKSKCDDSLNQQTAQDFKSQAISYLKQALSVAKAHFPEDSPHIARIQSQLAQP